VVETAVRDATGLTASRLTYVEARAFIGRRSAERSLRPSDVGVVRSALTRWWSAVTVIDFDSTIAASAGDAAERHAITGADAIHLASALALRGRGDTVVFATWDTRLQVAARREGLETLPR